MIRGRAIVLFLLVVACGGGSKSNSSFDAQQDQPECVSPDDCSAADQVCASGQCVASTCDDDLLSSGESDTDCGGDCPACTEGQRCDSASDCASAFCDGGICRDCESTEDCAPVPGTLCVASVCSGDAPLGQQCENNSQCESGFCVDSVCCDARCSGLCASCLGSETGAASGTCSSVLPNTDPADECEMDPVSTCAQSGMCNGAGGCAIYSAFTVCAPGSCIGQTFSDDSRCDGSGTCEPGEVFACIDTCMFGFCTPE